MSGPYESVLSRRESGSGSLNNSLTLLWPTLNGSGAFAE